MWSGRVHFCPPARALGDTEGPWDPPLPLFSMPRKHSQGHGSTRTTGKTTVRSSLLSPSQSQSQSQSPLPDTLTQPREREEETQSWTRELWFLGIHDSAVYALESLSVLVLSVLVCSLLAFAFHSSGSMPSMIAVRHIPDPRFSLGDVSSRRLSSVSPPTPSSPPPLPPLPPLPPSPLDGMMNDGTPIATPQRRLLQPQQDDSPGMQCRILSFDQHTKKIFSHPTCTPAPRNSVPASECEEGNCSGHGVCINGVCHCGKGWGGTDCSKPCTFSIRIGNDVTCYNYDPTALPLDGGCSAQCAEHGYCVEGACVCHEGWRGVDCSEVSHQTCVDDCSGNGVCIEGVCHCNPQYSGRDCSISVNAFPDCEYHIQIKNTLYCYDHEARRLHAPVSCVGHARCADGECICEDRNVPSSSIPCTHTVRLGRNTYCYRHSSMDVPFCPNSCSHNGVCLHGVCICADGFAGVDCSVPLEEPLPPSPPSSPSSPSSPSLPLSPVSVSTDDVPPEEAGCPSMCSHNGVCFQGTCVCTPDFVGLDCSIPVEDRAKSGDDLRV